MQEKQANTNTLVQILKELHLRNSTFSMQSSVVVFITQNKSVQLNSAPLLTLKTCEVSQPYAMKICHFCFCNCRLM